MITNRIETIPNMRPSLRRAMEDVASAIGRPLPAQPVVSGNQQVNQPGPARRYPNPGRCTLCPAQSVRDRTSSRTRCSLCNNFVCKQHNIERRYCDECVRDRAGTIIDNL